jgi:Helix-turn-helix domain
VEFEWFVTADAVASFLSLTRRRVLELARVKGGIPSHPIGSGSRKTYRFRLSEVADWLSKRRG